MIPKYGTRIVNKALIKAINALPCNACLKPAPNDAHHIKSRGSGGHDETHNLVALCRSCHQNLHRIGLNSFAEKHEG
jgi:5-methylcytosine-specific restriction endonuclease McrA